MPILRHAGGRNCPVGAARRGNQRKLDSLDPKRADGGYIERHGNAFTFATVKGAGHEAPGFQPYATYELVSSFVKGTLDKLTAPPPPRPAPRRQRGDTQSTILNRAVNEELERQSAQRRRGGV